jgi:hypothetical protein
LIRAASKEYEMDKEFLRLIETVDELLPEDSEKLDEETLICECFCVNVKDIRELCSGKVDLELLQTHLNLGRGCQSCLKRKDSWIDKIF